MKNLLIIIILMALIVACSNSAEKESHYTHIVDSTVTSIATSTTVPETGETMLRCVNDDDAPAKMLSYISNDAIYEETTAGSGTIIKVTTKDRVCILDKRWNCVDSDENSFIELKDALTERNTGNVGKVMGITCKEVPYDPTIFNTE